MTIVPVSYTHLDVYKRQGLMSVLYIIIIIIMNIIYYHFYIVTNELVSQKSTVTVVCPISYLSPVICRQVYAPFVVYCVT